MTGKCEQHGRISVPGFITTEKSEMKSLEMFPRNYENTRKQSPLSSGQTYLTILNSAEI